MDYKEKYEQALDNLMKIKAANKDNKELVDFIEYKYPELIESEDERIRKELIECVKGIYKGCCTEEARKERNMYLAWLEKQEEQKSISVTDDWIEDYWQHKKVNNPHSYNKGEEIQFDHQGFIKFCKKYCKKPATWSEEDEEIIKGLNNCLDELEEKNGWRYTYVNNKDIELNKIKNWLKSLKQRMKV